MAWRSNALACKLKDVLNFILKESFQGYQALLKITDQSVCESSQLTQKAFKAFKAVNDRPCG